MGTKPVGESRRGDEHSLRLRVQSRRRDLARPSWIHQRLEALGSLQGPETLDHAARADHDEDPGRDQENDDEPYERLQHFYLGYAWMAPDLHRFTAEVLGWLLLQSLLSRELRRALGPRPRSPWGTTVTGSWSARVASSGSRVLPARGDWRSVST